MDKETAYKKLKRQLWETRQQLFKVCTDPDSLEAQSIILNYKVLKAQGDLLFFGNQPSYGETIVGLMKQMKANEGKPYMHYEETKTDKT